MVLIDSFSLFPCICVFMLFESLVEIINWNQKSSSLYWYIRLYLKFISANNVTTTKIFINKNNNDIIISNTKNKLLIATMIKNKGCSIKSCILYPVSCILCPVSCILYPVSCILYPYILYPVSYILYPVSYILNPVSCILCPVSCILYFVSFILYPVSLKCATIISICCAESFSSSFIILLS